MSNRGIRIEGFMKPLKSQRVPHRFVFFDTETTSPIKGTKQNTFDLILGVMIYCETDKDNNIIRRETYTFNTQQEFIDLVSIYTNKRSTLYLFAHNIGFDIRVLNLPRLYADLGHESEPPIINEMAFIWKVNTPSGVLQFLDTANLGVRSVAKLGHDLGFPKMDIDFNTCTREELAIYCLRDVEILEKFVLSYVGYVDANELGSFKLTLASQSMAAFRTRFMHTAPYIHNNFAALKLERDGYHGGRVECFKLGTMKGRKVYYLDVNSMYPHSMIGDRLPIQFKGYTEDVNPRFMGARLSRFYVIADVTVQTDEPVYPIIKDNKLIFPIGSFRTVLYHDELEYAHKHGHIKQVHRCAVYEMGSLFDEYVDFFYHAKQQHTIDGNITWRTIDKLFLNSLYGKFGQLEPHRDLIGSIEYNDVYRLPCFNPSTGETYQEICWYGDVYRESKHGETPLSNPSVAGAITARARMTLWNYMKIAGRENVFYGDTDSLITNYKGYRKLKKYLDDTKLGYLKVEEESKYLEIHGNKDYTFGHTVKMKGVPKNATKLGKNAWEYLQFEGFISWLNRGAENSPTGEYRIKTRKTVYNKGVIESDGTITPFVLADSFQRPLITVQPFSMVSAE